MYLRAAARSKAASAQWRNGVMAWRRKRWRNIMALSGAIMAADGKA